MSTPLFDGPEPIPASGSRMVGRAWCVWCDQPHHGDHTICRAEMDASLWVPCVVCLGGGVDLADRQSGCRGCGGIGFKPAAGPMHEWIDVDGDGDDDDLY
jgi:hypothetical protein